MQRNLPRPLLFAAALTAGVLIALAVHIITSRLGMGLGAPWRDVSTSTDDLRSAFAWWLVAATAGLGSFVVAILLTDPPARTRRRTILEWVVGAGFLFLLVGSEHYGTGEVGIPTKVKLFAGLTALTLGAVMAFCGTFFALRR